MAFNYSAGALLKDRYKLVSLLGKGGFSVVWLVEDIYTNTQMAIKIYAPDKGLDDDGLSQFQKEYRRTRGLKHPHLLVPDHFDILKETNSPFLLMPYCPNGSLSSHATRESFDEEKIATLLKQVGSGLKLLHGQNIIHQDIKPDNILIDAKGNFLLTDFGISRQMRSTLKATSNQSYMTVSYSPPERYSSTPVDTPASDIFSLGVMLYEICTGNLPWDGVGGMVLNTGAAIPDLPERFSGRLNAIVKACMAKEYENRPTASDLITFGERFLQEQFWPKLEEVKSNSQSQSSSRKTQKINQGPGLENKNAGGSGAQTIGDSGIEDKVKTGSKLAKPLGRGIIATFSILVLYVTYYLIFGVDPRMVGEFRHYREKGDDYYASGHYENAQKQYEFALGLDEDIEGMDSVRQAYNDIEKWFEEHQQAWSEADDKNTVAGYEEYLENYPDGLYLNAARDRIEKLNAENKELRAWNSAKSRNTVSAYRGYISNYPSGRYVSSARSYIRNIEKSREQTAWNSATNRNTISAYRSFISSYPSSSYVGSAKSRIQDIEENQTKVETITYKGGAKYVGETKDGIREGEGTYYYKSGNIYKGGWKNGSKHGYGTFTWKSGDKYVGYYKNDLRNGKGTYYFSSGDIYEGEWLDNDKHGSGTYTIAPNTGMHIRNTPGCKKYVGSWEKDDKVGYGRCYDAGGNLLYSGYFSDGKPTGKYPSN